MTDDNDSQAADDLAEYFGIDITAELKRIAADAVAANENYVAAVQKDSEKPTPNGLHVSRSQVAAASMALGAFMYSDDEASADIPDIGVIVDAQHAIANVGAEPKFIVYSNKITPEQLETAKKRLEQHDSMMCMARMLEYTARQCLTGRQDKKAKKRSETPENENPAN